MEIMVGMMEGSTLFMAIGLFTNIRSISVSVFRGFSHHGMAVWYT